MENLATAKRLYAYIKANYTAVDLINFKALCSLATFRHYIITGSLPEIMLSFENVLSKHHATTIRRDRFSTTGKLAFRQGAELFNVCDDAFGTVAGAIQDRLRKTYPQYVRFNTTPILQMGGAPDIGVVVDVFRRADFERELLPVLAGIADFDTVIRHYNTDAALVGIDTPKNSVAVMQLFETVHKIFRKLRATTLTGEALKKLHRDELPIAHGMELVELFEGKRVYSYEDKTGLKAGMVLALKSLYPDVEFREEENVLRATVVNPFYYIGSTNIVIPSVAATEAGETAALPTVKATSVETSEGEEEAVGVVDDEEALKTAKALMRKYLGRPLPKIKEEEERVLAKYGSPEGEELAARMSSKLSHGFIRLYKIGKPYGVDDWLRTGAEYFAEGLNETVGHDILLPLVQGFGYARANHFRYRLTDAPPTITRIQ